MAVNISSNISTKNAADTYATHLANLGKGGIHSKDSIAQMNSITTDRRFRFMLCVVGNIGNGEPGLYWLNTPPNPTTAQLADNNNWQPVPLGIQSEGVLTLLGFENASSLTILDSTGSTGDTYIVDVGGAVNNPNIFGGQSVTLVVGDYLVYNNNQWNVVPTGASSINWNTLTGKPTTFTPSPHTHVIADIIDFPDLTSFLTDQDVVNSITDTTNSVLLGNVGAIKAYVTEQIDDIVFPTIDLSNYYTKSETEALIDAIQGYTLYTSPSLTQLNIDVPNPKEGEFAYIQGEYSMYRRVSSQWVKQYETANPSSDEALFLNNDLTDTTSLKNLGTVVLSENNYILYRDSSDTFLKVYKLVFGTATESLPDTVIPNDYDASNNAKYWQLAGSGGGGSGSGSGDLLASNNLSDLADIPTARTNLDVYSKVEVDNTSTFPFVETFTYTSGAQEFTLSQIPDSITYVTINGKTLSNPTLDYFHTGSTLTIQDSLIAGDEISIHYFTQVGNLVNNFIQEFSNNVTTAYTALQTDNNNIVDLDNASGITITLPNSLTIGTTITFCNVSGGVMTFNAEGTLQSQGGVNTINSQFEHATFYKRDATTWRAII